MVRKDSAATTRTVQRAADIRRRAPASVHLRLVHPRPLRGLLALTSRRLVIGRKPSEEPAARVGHETVSRNHLEVTWDARLGSHVGRDLGSHNGSWVDGVRVGEDAVSLPDGAVVRLGDVVGVIEHGPVPADGAPASREAVFGEAPAIQRLRAQLARAASDPSPVLVMGETGTGKEFAARELHRLSGRRGPFKALSCAELSPQLIESQLFGHVKGAFTGAAGASEGLFRSAERGTLFLDELGELPLELQAKLLRVLQESEVRPVGSTRSFKIDVRVLAATNRDLPGLVEEGTFRRDLYARLALWELRVPPLRMRRGDIPAWIDRLYEAWCRKRGGRAAGGPELDADATEALLLGEWRDNLRGVDRVVHRLAVDDKDVITLSDISELVSAARPRQVSAPPKPERTTRRPAPSKEELTEALERFDGSIRAVAKHFGRERKQVYRWLKAHGLRQDTD